MVSLKSGVFFSRFDGGVVFRGGGAPLIFRGAKTHQLIEAIARRMQGGETEEGIVAAFPEAARPAAQRVLHDLRAHNLLRERDAGDPPPDPYVVQRFGHLWSYLADNHRAPGAVMRAWRRLRFRVRGQSEAQLYAARALVECGARCVQLISTGRRDAELAGGLRALDDEFDGLELEIVSEPDPGEAVDLYVSGGTPAATDTLGLRDTWFLGVVSGRLLVAHVVGELSPTLGGWRAMLRPAEPGSDGPALPPLRVALGANVLVFAIFNTFAGLEGRLDRTRPHVIQPWAEIVPVAPPAPVRRRLQPPAVSASAVSELNSEEPRDAAADQLARLAPLFDPICGFLEEGDEDLVQTPLSMVGLRVHPEDRGGRTTTVRGWGFTHEEARLRAVLRGVEAYVASSAAGRGAASVACALSAGSSRARAEALACGAAAGAWDGPWREAGPQDLADPAAFKLWKLLGLLSGVDPRLRLRTGSAAAFARLELPEEALEAIAEDPRQALLQVLGEACARHQLAAEDRPVLAAAARAGPAQRLEVVPIDLGYPGLEDLLSCHLATWEA